MCRKDDWESTKFDNQVEQNEKASSSSTKSNDVTIGEHLAWSQCAEQMLPMCGGRCAKFKREMQLRS